MKPGRAAARLPRIRRREDGEMATKSAAAYPGEMNKHIVDALSTLTPPLAGARQTTAEPS